MEHKQTRRVDDKSRDRQEELFTCEYGRESLHLQITTEPSTFKGRDTKTQRSLACHILRKRGKSHTQTCQQATVTNE